ncbi:MAG: exodeoxyribonuclease V subunit gamma, partial [Wenzhouxiangella sp.]
MLAWVAVDWVLDRVQATGRRGSFVKQATLSSNDVPPGLAIVQSNSPEQLRDLLVAHLQRQPLAPLEAECILTQSNGIGRWLQLALARDRNGDPGRGGLGISASTSFELPARFFWESYGIVLGEAALPETSPFDAGSLRWRLYGLLPDLLDEAVFQPLRHYLEREGGAARRRWQLAGELAELFEQYQIYRADWLLDWEQGEESIRDARGRVYPLDTRQAWQPALWRHLLKRMPEAQRRQSRAHLHQAFVKRLQQAAGDGQVIAGLPRRLVVFGISSLPAQMVDALAALAEHIQVLICLHNPCRHYWADIIEGRDLLRSRPGKRLNHRADWPAQLDDETIHRHANPLLAAWGRQGRDFFALLDDKDQPERYREWFERIDLFEDFVGPDAHGLLARIQQGILDLEPAVEDPEQRCPIDPDADHSLRFHAAHSRQREVEILHDQLLAALEDDARLQPRHIIVMVPDIDAYAPHIEAVFGARAGGKEGDPRHVPFHIADRRERLVSPTLKAFTTLLDLPRLRLTASEVLDLLNVPAVHRRFGIESDQIERVAQWLSQAGVRWGLDGEHRASLGLDRRFEQFSWLSGIRRMLLGHASGEADAFDDILPFDEVAGSEADLAGRLAWFIERLHHHWQSLADERTMDEWAQALRDLIDDCLALQGDAEELAGYQLDQAIDDLVEAADLAGLDQTLPLEVVRDALTDALDQGHVSHRFLGGKVNFSTLMPMRAIPFKMVCLLGMNDGDYPRTRKPADFDLMGERRFYRPGDRSRREDDRYLFLEAVLAARQRLYISWVGRSIHNDEKQPPSVLVGQLRDHIAAGWQLGDGPDGEQDPGEGLLDALTTWHPLQAFSPRYFAGDPALFTYAAEWRQAHPEEAGPGPHPASLEPLDAWPLEGAVTIQPLTDFLAQPLRHFTGQRLGARLDMAEDRLADSEPFRLDGLAQWALDDELLNELLRTGDETQWPGQLARAGERLALSGRLPLGDVADQLLDAAAEKALLIAGHWLCASKLWPETVVPGPVSLAMTGLEGEDLLIEQWLPELRRSEQGEHALILATATRLVTGKSASPPPRWEKLIRYWPLHLLINAAGVSTSTVVVHEKG